MTQLGGLASFVSRAEYSMLSREAVDQLKIRVLDTLGVAIAAQEAAPIRAIRQLLTDLDEPARSTGHIPGAPDGTGSGGGRTSTSTGSRTNGTVGRPGQATYIGGGTGPIDRVAFFNGALSRYLDFMDSYLAPGETCHPSDNLGAVMAAAESVGADGRELLTSLAVAYQVQARLSDEAPVRAKGFDHTTQGAYASAASVAKALGLDTNAIANAIAISGTANNALRVTRTGDLSHWKGLAYPNTAKEGTFAALLASHGITGPAEVFEGNKGFMDSIAGEFSVDWEVEGLEKVRETVVKKYNAEVHSQTALEAALAIRATPGFDPARIREIQVDTFDVAYSIIGGGEEGDKRSIHTKEEADHSLPYMVAVALLDGEVLPAQYEPERITADDVQQLMRRVVITPRAELSAQFPTAMPARVRVVLDDGTALTESRDSYAGFTTEPLSWDQAMTKYRQLVEPFTGAELADRIAEVIRDLENRPVAELTGLLARVPRTRADHDTQRDGSALVASTGRRP